jgi:hypothetical protein
MDDENKSAVDTNIRMACCLFATTVSLHCARAAVPWHRLCTRPCIRKTPNGPTPPSPYTACKQCQGRLCKRCVSDLNGLRSAPHFGSNDNCLAPITLRQRGAGARTAQPAVGEPASRHQARSFWSLEIQTLVSIHPSPNKRGRNGLSLSMLSRHPVQLPPPGCIDCGPGGGGALYHTIPWIARLQILRHCIALAARPESDGLGRKSPHPSRSL